MIHQMQLFKVDILFLCERKKIRKTQLICSVETCGNAKLRTGPGLFCQSTYSKNVLNNWTSFGDFCINVNIYLFSVSVRIEQKKKQTKKLVYSTFQFLTLFLTINFTTTITSYITQFKSVFQCNRVQNRLFVSFLFSFPHIRKEYWI